MWCRLQLGNNVYTGASVARSVLAIDGRDAVTVSTDPEAPYLLLWLDLFDTRGECVARLRRTEWTSAQSAYEYARAPRRVVVRTVHPRRPIFDVAYRPDEALLAVTYAELNSPARRRIVIDETLGIVVTDPFTARTVSALASETAQRSLDRISLQTAFERRPVEP